MKFVGLSRFLKFKPHVLNVLRFVVKSYSGSFDFTGCSKSRQFQEYGKNLRDIILQLEIITTIPRKSITLKSVSNN